MSRRVLLWLMLIGVSFLVLAPFGLVLLASFHPAGLPEFAGAATTFDHYVEILSDTRNLRALFNSLVVASGATVLSVLVSATAGFALSRFSFRGKKTLMVAILGVFMIPITVNTIPLYLILQKLSWLNSWQGLIVPYQALILPLNIWILKNFFDTIPTQLDEAAFIDGVNLWSLFWRIHFPLIWPGVAVATIFAFRFSWNEFVFAATFTSSNSMLTWQGALYNFLGSTGSDWGPLTAGVIIGMVPVVLLYSVFQRQFVSGLTLGGVKE